MLSLTGSSRIEPIIIAVASIIAIRILYRLGKYNSSRSNNSVSNNNSATSIGSSRLGKIQQWRFFATVLLNIPSSLRKIQQ